MDKARKVLRLSTYQETLGTAADKSITTITDFDLQEFLELSNDPQVFEEIRQSFVEKFDIINQSSDIFFIDFKAGYYNAKTPLHWDYKTIKQGYIVKEGQKYHFTDILRQQSTIKMDIVAKIDGIFREFSDNYYFCFDGSCSYRNKGVIEEIITLHRDFREYKGEKTFKALKRYYSILKLLPSPPKGATNLLIKFFNSPTGQLNSVISNLNTLKTLLETNLNKVKLIDLKTNISLLKDPRVLELLNCKSKIEMLKMIDGVISRLEEVVEKMSRLFLKRLGV